MSVKREKQILRERYRGRKGNCKSLNDKKIHDRILSLKQYKGSDCVFTYVSKEYETDTRSLIERMLKEGKAVAVPKCRVSSSSMEFYYINSLDELHVGEYGILQPNGDFFIRARDTERTICLVPGICFSEDGYRVGHGKGYYDRFLKTFKGFSAGICPDERLLKRIPIEPTDKRVDLIITQSTVVEVYKQK